MHVRRPSPAPIIASIALFFSLGGTAIAAHHYLVTSTGQIKPSVLKKLKGKTGATGATGAAGSQGKEGPQGKEGKEGPFAGTLPSGKTTTGAWALEGVELVETAISFPFPLASRPTVHIVAKGESARSGCSGSEANPGAAPGNLCIFEGWQTNFEPGKTKEFVPEESGTNNESGFTGAILYGRPKAPGTFEDAGTFAVTGS